MIFDTLHCNNCHSNIMFRVSTRELLVDDRAQSESGTPVATVSCPDCKHVYDYGQMTVIGTAASPDPLPVGGKTHKLYDVALPCDTEGCEAQLSVRAPRQADVTQEELLDELPNWKLHDLRCPEGHHIQHARRFEL